MKMFKYMKDNTQAFYIFRDIVPIVTFILAMHLEDPTSKRQITLVVIFLLFFVWNRVKDTILLHSSGHIVKEVLLFLPDAIFLFLLDDDSKFVVNYYFNVYYFYVLIHCGFVLKGKSRILSSTMILLASFVKYYGLFEVALSKENPTYTLSYVSAYSFFTIVIFVTIVVFIEYSGSLKEQKDIVETLNLDINNKSKLLQEMAINEERSKIARDIHDTVGHNLVGLIMNLEYLRKVSTSHQEKVSNCHEIAVGCLQEIRKSIGYMKEPIFNMRLMDALQHIGDTTLERTNLKVILTYDEDFDIHKKSKEELIRIVQESITNAVKHANASCLTIKIQNEKGISIEIFDDGTVDKEIVFGNGLQGIVERVESLGGKVTFAHNGGFRININIPKGEYDE